MHRFRTNLLLSSRVLNWLVCGLALTLAVHAFAQDQPEDVEIQLESFGVASVYRPSDVAAIRLRLTNNPAGSLDEAVTVWVHVELPNADGDVGQYGRVVTLTRGRPTPVWLYVPLPPEFATDTLLPVRVFEMRDGRRRAEIAGRRIAPRDAGAQYESPVRGLIGVIGQRPMGLRDYSVLHGVQVQRPLPAHEFTRVVAGIRPEALPDHWIGLQGYEAIAWAEASPRDLTSDTAAALREYVRRGGHLIISIPEDTNPWQFGVSGQHPLEDMLPRQEPRKDEAVSIRELAPVLSKARDAEVDFNYGIRVFKELKGDFDVIDNHFEPLIAMPDGRVIVIRRTFGHGWVTVIGVDLTQQRLYSVPLSNGSRGLPQADAFWNRILGRRVDTPTNSELQQMHDAELLTATVPHERPIGQGELISDQIAMTTQAGVGLLLALFLFAAYWLLAGPGGFALLKVYGQVRHAWLMFASAAIVFTAAAWASVSMLRISEPRIRHVTVLDHIVRPEAVDRPEDPQLQRAVTWFSLYTPGYGFVPVEIDSMPGQRDVLLPWEPPLRTSMTRFPNVDRFTVDVGSRRAGYEIPSRSTSTQMYANWMGGLDGRWGEMIRQDINQPVRVEIDQGRREIALRGVLQHNLPGALRDVSVIWVRNLRRIPRRYAVSDQDELPWVPQSRSGEMLNLGYYLRLSDPWEPGESLELATLQPQFDARALLETGIRDRYVTQYRPAAFGSAVPTILREADYSRMMEMLSMYHQLTPPRYFKARRDERDSTDEVVFDRVVGRELDLSPWLTRPCLIIMGYLDDSPMSIPLRVGEADSPPVSEGVTLVRWIYPLPVEEDIAFPPSLEEEGEEEAAEG